MTEILYVLLPNGRQQFLDANGEPLAGGSVGMYTPGTLNPLETWEDPYGTTPNENPIPLDAAGSALIYGVGQYRQIVQDLNGVTIWDALTYGQAPSNAGSTTGFGQQMDLASAPTTDLGTIASHNVLITGDAQIASFGESANISAPLYYIEFDSTAGLVYSSPGLLLPGAQDIFCRGGDAALVEYQGSGDWKVICFWPAAGQNFGTQVTLASAATTDLGSAESNNVKISGTVSITSLGNSAVLSNPIYLVEFSGALTLTYNASALILPTSANIETTAGDTAIFEYLGGGDWKCRQYTYNSGLALKGSFISETVFTGSGNWNPPAGCRNVEVLCIGAGGGGGGASTSSDKNAAGGGGGGGGAYSRYFGANPGATAVTIGAAGAGGVNQANGANGGQSSFGALVVCGGGTGGGYTTPNGSSGLAGVGAGGGGGTVGTAGNLEAGSGEAGSYGIGQNNGFAAGGKGGDSMRGGGGAGSTSAYGTSANGGAGGAYGAGGGGASSYSSGSAENATGGAGLAGFVSVRSYS